jgi:hypothetical protein
MIPQLLETLSDIPSSIKRNLLHDDIKDIRQITK